MTEPQNSSTLNFFGCFLAAMLFFALVFGSCAVQCSLPKAIVVSSPPRQEATAPPSEPGWPRDPALTMPESVPARPKAEILPEPSPVVVQSPPPRSQPVPTPVEEEPEPPPPDANIKKRLDDLLVMRWYDPTYIDSVYLRNITTTPIKLFIHVANGTWEPRIFKPGATVFLTSSDHLTAAYEVPGKGYKKAALRVYHQPYSVDIPLKAIRESAILHEISRVDDENLTFDEVVKPRE